MRNVTITLASLVIAAASAGAQTPTATASEKTTTQVTAAPKPVNPFTTTGQVDFGVRATDETGDASRLRRYRDLSDGAMLDLFRFNSEGGGWVFDAGANDVGRDDQRFWGEFLRVGKMRASFFYDQLPTFYAATAQTPYVMTSPGVFTMDQSTRALMASNKVSWKTGLTSLLQPVDLDSRRDTAAFAMVLSPSRQVDIDVTFNSRERQGTMPYFASFGFSNAPELALPLDDRTNDLSMKAEWTGDKALLRVGYDGSWFMNDLKSITWENPLAVTDRVYPSAYSDGRGPSVSRMAMAPNSTQHTVSTTGSYRLPGRSRIAAYLGIGSVKSDAEILPYTTNTAAPALPLERSTVDGDVRMITGNVSFTSRPASYLWLNVKYRYQDQDNRTATFHSPEWILFDGVYHNDPLHTEAFSVRRKNFDADASFTPATATSLKIGFGRYESDRTFRIYETTVDNVFRTSFDVTGNQYFSVRALYEHAVREGEGFERGLLEEVSEQPGMRHYDVANRSRDRVTALFTVNPAVYLGVSASVGAGRDDYEDSEFGLRDNTNRVYSVGLDLVPSDAVSLGFSYTYENFTAVQASRTALPAPSPQWFDPTRDWTTDADDTTRTIAATADLLKLIPRTELRFGYDLSSGKATYVYGVVPGSAVAVPQQLPAIRNELTRGTADVKYFLTRRLALGVVYWYDEYEVDDFAMDTDILTGQADLPSTLILGYVYAPYKAHTAMAKLTVLW